VLGTLAGLWLVVIAWGSWTYATSFGLEDPLDGDAARFLALGPAVLAATWTTTSPRVDHWIVLTAAGALVAALPGLLLLLG
jgi:hypothetical protein